MKKLLIVLVILIIAAVIIIPKLTSSPNKGNVPPGAAPKGPMTVNGVIVVPSKLDNTVRTTGTILAFDEIDLHTEAAGRVVRINFQEGSHVRKGDLLLKLNDEDLQAAIRKSDLQIKLNEENLDRQKKLLAVQATAQQDFDIAKSQVDAMKADRDAIVAAINKTEIHAPFNGIIGLRYVSTGSYVTPATRVASLQNIDPVKVDFAIPEKYSNQVNTGDSVLFTSESTGSTFYGKVFATEPRIDASTRTLQIRALCDNTKGKILPGSFVKISLRLKENNNALMIPTQAMVPVLKGQTVFVVKNGIAIATPITIGTRTDTQMEVTDGLHAGDTIITTGIMSLKSKMPVKVLIK